MHEKHEILSFYVILCTMMLFELNPLLNAFGDKEEAELHPAGVRRLPREKDKGGPGAFQVPDRH